MACRPKLGVRRGAFNSGLEVFKKLVGHFLGETADDPVAKLRELAAEAGVATQMGTQGHAFPGYLRTVELLNADAIGPVSEVHVITDRPGTFWQQGLTPSTDRPPTPSAPDPAARTPGWR